MARKKSDKVSTRTRFEILKRDGFRCVYCGVTPLDIPLHVDHVVAVANGGETVAENLVTSCRCCNLGKSAVPLDKRKYSTMDPEAAREHAAQVAAYIAAQKEIADAKREASKQLIGVWCEVTGCKYFHRNLEQLLPKAVAEFGMATVYDAIGIVASKRLTWIGRKEETTNDVKYFCGILRRMRDRQETV